jgi:protein associated with RNAse G/E
VNITMPATFHASVVEWIDLDLDFRVHLNNSVQRLDQAEFEKNVHLMRYPSGVIEQVHIACQAVEAGLQSKEYPFDHGRQVELYQQIKKDLLTCRG